MKTLTKAPKVKTTQELLLKYQSLMKKGKTQEAKTLVDENRDDKRLVSLIELRESFLDAFKKELDQQIARSNRARPVAVAS